MRLLHFLLSQLYSLPKTDKIDEKREFCLYFTNLTVKQNTHAFYPEN